MVDPTVEASNCWTKEEQELDISAKEALALYKVLLSFSDSLKNAWVDGLVDNQAVVYSWQRQGGRSMSLNRVIKKLFFTTSKLNIALHVMYIPSKENEADATSHCLTRSIKWSLVSGVSLRFSASLSPMGPVLHFLRPHGWSCMVIALDVYPKKHS